jgi:hypothetical protein
MDLGESPSGRDEFAVRAGCHVAVGQHGARACPLGQPGAPGRYRDGSARGAGERTAGGHRPARRHRLLERLRQRTRDAVRARLAAPRCWTRTYPARPASSAAAALPASRPSSSALATTGGGTSVSRLPARRISRSRVNGTVRYQNCPNACCRHARIGRSGRVMRRLGEAASRSQVLRCQGCSGVEKAILATTTS